MTTNNLTRIGLLAFVLVAVLAAVAPAGAAPTDASLLQANQTSGEPAVLAIQQPHYISGDVRTEQANGRTVYVARGEVLQLRPQNFAPDDVVQARVDTARGSLSYDDEMGVYQLDVGNNTGTYELSWIVTQPVEREVQRNNTTATETVIREVEYTALVRIEGGTGLVHLPEQDHAELEALAGKWEEVSVIDGQDFTVSQIEAAVRLRYDALSYLTGNFTHIGILLVFGGIGGWLWIVLGVFPPIWVARRLRKHLNVYRGGELAEGTLADRAVEDNRRQTERRFSQTDFEAWFSDSDAAHLRDIADTPKDLWRTLVDDGPLAPETLYQAYLQAMGHCGWTAVVECDDTDTITSVDLTDEPGSDAETVDLTDREAVSEIIPHVEGARELTEFDYVHADFDDSDLDLDADITDAEGFVGAVDGWDQVSDPESSASLLRDAILRVAEHPYTDRDGYPTVVQEVLNELLDLSYRARDDIGTPSAVTAVDVLERAVDNSDPNKQTRARVREVRDGVAD